MTLVALLALVALAYWLGYASGKDAGSLVSAVRGSQHFMDGYKAGQLSQQAKRQNVINLRPRKGEKAALAKLN